MAVVNTMTVSTRRNVARSIADALAARPKLVRSRYEPPASANAGELAGSNFERKYRLEGRRIQAVAVLLADEDDALANEQA